jgi:hypothetical protein
MFWIALAAQVSLPAVEQGGLWKIFSGDDFPSRLIHDGEAVHSVQEASVDFLVQRRP